MVERLEELEIRKVELEVLELNRPLWKKIEFWRGLVIPAISLAFVVYSVSSTNYFDLVRINLDTKKDKLTLEVAAFEAKSKEIIENIAQLEADTLKQVQENDLLRAQIKGMKLSYEEELLKTKSLFEKQLSILKEGPAEPTDTIQESKKIVELKTTIKSLSDKLSSIKPADKFSEYEVAIKVDTYKTKSGRGWDYLVIQPDPYICLKAEGQSKRYCSNGDPVNRARCNNKYSCKVSLLLPPSPSYQVHLYDFDRGTEHDLIGTNECTVDKECRLNPYASGYNSATVFIEAVDK